MTSRSNILRFRALALSMTMVAMVLSTIMPGSASAAPCVNPNDPLNPRIVNNGTLALSGCEISGNSTPGDGGGVENHGDLTLTDVVVSGNLAGGNGGGIYNDSKLTLVNVTVSGNTSSALGGGIHNDGGTISMVNVTVTDNTAGAGGGGIANVLSGTVVGASLAVANNTTTTGDGGGVLNDGSSFCLTSEATFDQCFVPGGTEGGGNSLVSGNRAVAGNGGGVANDFGAVDITDSTVDGNHADGGDGGGIWNEFSTLATSNATISNNSASGNGGGIAVDVGSLLVGINVTIAQNGAGGNGGGVYTANIGDTSLGSATIADNAATGSGGGVYNDDASGATTELENTLLARNSANCAGTIGEVVSPSNNLDTGTTCAFAGIGDQTNVGDANVGLGTLAANGGPTQGSSTFSAPMMTLALTPTSPAVDAAGATCPAFATDERGVSRPQDGNKDGIAACDIGAFELTISCLNANPLLGAVATGGKLCTILEVDGAKVDITGPAGQIQGNICIGPAGKLAMSGDNFATNPGEVLLDATASCSGCRIGKRVSAVDQPVDLSAEITACKEAAADNQPAPAGRLTCGPLSRKTLTGTQTILGAAGENVICVDSVNVGNNQLITLSRDPAAVGPDTTFIFVVTGKFAIQGKIKTDGTTVQPADVLYNVIGTGARIAFSGGGGGTGCCKAEIDGTLIALDREWGVSPGLINGQVCGGMDMSFSSGSGVHCPDP